MKNLKQIFHRMTLGLVCAALPMLGGCSNTITWQEEVKLLDGRVITVTQKWQYDRDRMPRDFKLTFKLPEFGNQEITWHENLSPQVLNLYEGKLYVVGLPVTEIEFLQYGKPYPEYVPYRYESGQWQRIPFSEIPVAIYNTNIFLANEPPNGVKLVTLSMKAEEMADDRIRDPLKRISPTFKTPH